MEMDQDWCSEEEAVEEGVPSPFTSSEESDDDSSREGVQLSEEIDEEQEEIPHDLCTLARSDKKKRGRRWRRDIPFSRDTKLNRVKNSSQGTADIISQSYPLTSRRRQDMQSPTFTPHPAISIPSSVPKFTLSNLRSNTISTSNSPPTPRRFPLPHRLVSRLSPLKIRRPSSASASSSTSSSSTASPSTALPSAFRSSPKPGAAGETERKKKKVLLRLENNVIVQPSSSYDEKLGIDSSAILSPRSPPLNDNHGLGMSSWPKMFHVSDSENDDSPPASLLREVVDSPIHATSDALAKQLEDSANATNAPKGAGSSSNSDKAKDNGDVSPFDLEALMGDVTGTKGDDKIPEASPKDVPKATQTTSLIAEVLKKGEKRTASSSLKSDTPVSKMSKSSLHSTEGVFFMDEDIDRFQGSGPEEDGRVGGPTEIFPLSIVLLMSCLSYA